MDEMIFFNKLDIKLLIQLMLAPAVMISACGLLILGINNKYSIVVNRIRLLNEERRKIKFKIGGEAYSTEENVRLESITIQLKLLVFRVKLVRNSVLAYTASIGLFVLTSLLLGLLYFLKINILYMFIILAFIAGMISLFCGVYFAAREILKGYEIINLEVKADE